MMLTLLSGETKKDGFYKETIDQARRWHGLMEVIIKHADLEDAEEEKKLARESTNLLPNISVADELVKLDQLRKQGLLTDEEFSSQKTKLLEN